MGQDGAMGDATELGLFNFASSVLNVDRVQHFNPKVYEIPFNSVNKWQLTVHALGDHGGKKAQVFVKGAPERVISRCTTYMGSAGVPVKIDEQFLQLLNTIYEMRGGQGERVLGFATSSKLHDVTAFTEDSVLHDRAFRTMVEEKYMQDLCFLGFITLQDPPRPEVSKAIDACRSAGVKTIMVTGDHRISKSARSEVPHALTSCNVLSCCSDCSTDRLDHSSDEGRAREGKRC
jgi:magnesium-transporting ATPase (P-type)